LEYKKEYNKLFIYYKSGIGSVGRYSISVGLIFREILRS